MRRSRRSSSPGEQILVGRLRRQVVSAVRRSDLERGRAVRGLMRWADRGRCLMMEDSDGRVGTGVRSGPRAVVLHVDWCGFRSSSAVERCTLEVGTQARSTSLNGRPADRRGPQSCRPHSVLSLPTQRPERGSLGSVGRWVQGWQPMRQVALGLERVHDHVVVGDVAVDVVLGPGGERVDLHQAAQVAGDDRRLAAGGGLLAAEAAHPGRLALEGPVELADLHRRAAVLRVDPPELLVVVRHGHHPQVEAVAAPDHLHGLERLGEVVAGVDEHHLDARGGPWWRGR